MPSNGNFQKPAVNGGALDPFGPNITHTLARPRAINNCRAPLLVVQAFCRTPF
jgi:hypothetical protein